MDRWKMEFRILSIGVLWIFVGVVSAARMGVINVVKECKETGQFLPNPHKPYSYYHCVHPGVAVDMKCPGGTAYCEEEPPCGCMAYKIYTHNTISKNEQDKNIPFEPIFRKYTVDTIDVDDNTPTKPGIQEERRDIVYTGFPILSPRKVNDKIKVQVFEKDRKATYFEPGKNSIVDNKDDGALNVRLQSSDTNGYPFPHEKPHPIVVEPNAKGAVVEQSNGFIEDREDPVNIYSRPLNEQGRGRMMPAPIPSNGCPNDPFMKTENVHKPLGVSKPYTTLRECQENCISMSSCIGIDYNKLPNVPNDDRCFFLFANSSVFSTVLNRCCDHYHRTTCKREQTTTESNAIDNFGGFGAGRQRTTTSGPFSPFTTAATITNGPFSVRPPFQARTTTLDSNSAFGSSITRQPGERSSTSNPVPNNDETTIPDSGCPYIFQKFENKAHPFGINISSTNEEGGSEACKRWCLVRPYCVGVDFDLNTNTCYYHRLVEDVLVKDSIGVMHFRKGHCSPPLRCWEMEASITDLSMTTVTDPSTRQIQCQTMCFVEENVIERVIRRGCLDPSIDSAVGCTVMPEDPSSIKCFCDTDRCNGLSVLALSSQLLHLPLNGDMSDHSGTDLHGAATPGYEEPTFTCFDKIVNCSAYFNGRSCISIPQLSQQQWGVVSANGSVSGQASFAIWFKRFPVSPGNQIRGIFGNSVDSAPPSWRIQGSESARFIEAGVSTIYGQTNDPLGDYAHIEAKANDWHLVVMTYDDHTDLSVTPPRLPTLKLFLDGVEQDGNSRRDNGTILVLDQYVGVGCVQLNNFTGFIDEVRIFNTPLRQEDIAGLLSMKDTKNI
ncbi:unnamed protein product [Owenia fusiformis]|uniref:Uncharacterized protein n=1 Tax=Owenia fusiformis TaxID=6347 RepID=A0A8J1XS00_OWEFU|nr:unnamed protein product [Owenia fusiformis]